MVSSPPIFLMNRATCSAVSFTPVTFVYSSANGSQKASVDSSPLSILANDPWSPVSLIVFTRDPGSSSHSDSKSLKTGQGEEATTPPKSKMTALGLAPTLRRPFSPDRSSAAADAELLVSDLLHGSGLGNGSLRLPVSRKVLPACTLRAQHLLEPVRLQRSDASPRTRRDILDLGRDGRG